MTRGDKCPTCGEMHEIEGDGVEVDGDYVYQECWCNRCDATWRAVYKHDYNITHERRGSDCRQ